MKNYKKGLLTVMILSAMSLMAAQNNVIYVTTFDDENGENLDQCSLREAIKTAADNKSFGGCNVGNTLGTKDYIQLEAGTYKLNSELKPTSQIIILGKAATDWEKKSPLTNDYPFNTPLKSTIDGQNKTRIFNTVESEATLSLVNVALTNGYSSGNGGAVYAGGPFDMSGSAITNSKAEKSGGAIYLVAQNSEKTVSVSQSLIQGNDASTGSVFAMDCEANLLKSAASITLDGSSIVKNGLQKSGSSILDFCGNAKASITTNTIAKNIANKAIINIASELGHIVGSSSTIGLVSNTIVENQAPNTWLYDENSAKSLLFNVLAFNSGRDCSYSSMTNTPIDKTVVVAKNNALVLSGNQMCTLPADSSSTKNVENNIDVAGKNISSLLSNYQDASEYNLYLPLYYPLNNLSADDLVDTGASGCSETDQRGLARVQDGTLTVDPSQRNSCDIGSVELLRLTAADIVDLTNTSAVTLVEDLKTERDRLKALVENKDTNKEYLIMYTQDYNNAVNRYNYTQQYMHYRTVFVDPFSLAIREEEVVPNSNGAHLIKALDKNNYNVTVEALGVGDRASSDSTIDLNKIIPDQNLKCEWKQELGQVIIYRTDGKITSASEAQFCKYTLQAKDGSQTSSGIMQAAITNIAPIAKDDTYIISPSNNLEVTVNPLENDSDDGDGPISTTNLPNIPFYVDPKLGQLPIQFVKLPDGLIMTAEREGQCPGDNAKDKCYGGKIHFAVKNAFSQFDYPVTYQIYDADGLVSNVATITLKNTAVNTNTTASGGGGSLGIYSVLGLLGLTLYRRFRK